MNEFFEKLSPSSWESLDNNQTWNIKRPIWLQALIHMIEPHLVPVLHNIIEKLESLAKLDKKDVKKDLKTVLNDVLDIIELIPVPILRLCVEIESRMPSYVKPLAGKIKVIIECKRYKSLEPLTKNLTFRLLSYFLFSSNCYLFK